MTKSKREKYCEVQVQPKHKQTKARGEQKKNRDKEIATNKQTQILEGFGIGFYFLNTHCGFC